MKLRTFFFLIVVTLALFGLTAITALIMTTNLASRVAAKLGAGSSKIYAAEELQGNLLIHNRESLLLETTGQEEHRLNKFSARAAIKHWRSEIRHNVGSPVEESSVDRIQRLVDEYLIERDELTSAGRQPLEIYHSVAPTVDEAYERVQQLIDVAFKESTEARAAVRRQAGFATAFATVAGLLLVVVVPGVLGGLRVLVYRPLLRLRDRISDFTVGDVALRVPLEGLGELREIASVVNDMAERLSQQRHSQIRFVSAVAHDLRTPLSAVKSAAELLAPSMNLPDEKRWEVVDVIRRQVTHLDRMVGDLLDTTRIESGELELRSQVEDLRDLVREAAVLHQEASSLHRVEIELPGSPVVCECDPARISQVLNNLVSNGIKYSPHGGTVRVSLEQRDDQGVVSVTDEGMGIAPDDLAHIFEPFRRSNLTRGTIPGVGLGLSVARRIVNAHDGRIEVESEVGRGSTLRIILPLAAHDAA